MSQSHQILVGECIEMMPSLPYFTFLALAFGLAGIHGKT